METSDYINELIKSGIKNDSEIARRLNLTRGAVHMYRKNMAQFGPDTTIRIADLLHIPPEKIAADMNALKCKSVSNKKRWKKIAASLCIAASVGGGVIGGGGNANAALPSPAEELRRMFIM